MTQTNPWQTIDSAPRDGTLIDLWAKWWRADTDTFIGTRVPDCRWVSVSGHERWSSEHAATPHNSRFTHWMAKPAPPEGQTQ